VDFEPLEIFYPTQLLGRRIRGSKASNEPLEIDDVGLAKYLITTPPDRVDDFFNHDPTPGSMEHLFDLEGWYLLTEFSSPRSVPREWIYRQRDGLR